MDSKLNDAQGVFLDRINRICGRFGLNNIVAQLYAILYLSKTPLSLDDMVERLRISKGSASTNIRLLEGYGAVKSVWVKGSRKDFYEAETDISKVILDRVRSMVRGRIVELDDILKSSQEAISSVDPADKDAKEDVKIFKERLKQLKEFRDKGQLLYDLLNSELLVDVMNNRIALDFLRKKVSVPSGNNA